MQVKLQHHLQPSAHAAHGVILSDDDGIPFFVAMQLPDRVVYADIGEPDFETLLRAMGGEPKARVVDIKPKSIEEMLRKS